MNDEHKPGWGVKNFGGLIMGLSCFSIILGLCLTNSYYYDDTIYPIFWTMIGISNLVVGVIVYGLGKLIEEVTSLREDFKVKNKSYAIKSQDGVPAHSKENNGDAQVEVNESPDL